LNISVKFYKNNYERFAVMLYAIVHELSLLIIQNKDFNKIINFETFRNDAESFAISKFGLEDKSDVDEHSTKISHSPRIQVHMLVY